MKGALVTRYGSPDAILIADVPKPVPGPGEILVRVYATSVSRTDTGELAGSVFLRPLYGRRSIFGMDVAGVVEEVGQGVTRFQLGDRIFGMCPFRRNGAQAEYVCLRESASIATLPASIPFQQAALCEGAFYASAMIVKLAVGPGKRVLVFGASGAIGSAAVQLAKVEGAEVTAAVESRHLELAHSLGADHVVDSSSEDFAKLGRRFDVVYDSVGKMPIRQWRRLLKPAGMFATTDVGPNGQNLLAWFGAGIVRSKRVQIPLPPRASATPFVERLRDLMVDGRFRAVVDRTYALDDIADAYRYVKTGKKAGIVVVRVAE